MAAAVGTIDDEAVVDADGKRQPGAWGHLCWAAELVVVVVAAAAARVVKSSDFQPEKSDK